jgi:hypothetical protein
MTSLHEERGESFLLFRLPRGRFSYRWLFGVILFVVIVMRGSLSQVAHRIAGSGWKALRKKSETDAEPTS